jgi:prepilin-type N-terminal cleavage/methylation domain-containing protein
MKNLQKNKDGFTLLELMIAVTIFSVILLVGAATMIQVGKMYYKGINSARTQEITRNIVDEVSRGTQFSKSGATPLVKQSFDGVEHYAYCVGGKRYTFRPNLGLVSDSSFVLASMTGPHGLWKDDAPGGACVPAKITTNVVALSTNGQEMLSENMRVSEFCIRKTNVASLLPAGQTPTTGSRCEIDYDEPAEGISIFIRVAFGDNELLEFNDDGKATSCRSASIGVQWCAISQLDTQVFRRLN